MPKLNVTRNEVATVVFAVNANTEIVVDIALDEALLQTQSISPDARKKGKLKINLDDGSDQYSVASMVIVQPPRP